MNSYRIDTFELADGRWKAVAYKCGTYIAEITWSTESIAIQSLAVELARWVNDQ